MKSWVNYPTCCKIRSTSLHYFTSCHSLYLPLYGDFALNHLPSIKMLPDDGHLPSELPVLPKRRRTEAQLERKRARDREAQRVNREKNKGRISCMESDLALLQSRLTEMSERMSELTNTLETLQQDPAQSYSTSLFHNQLNQPVC